MKKTLLFVYALQCMMFVAAQQSKTFTIENLQTKDGILKTRSYDDILKRLIRSDVEPPRGFSVVDSFPFNIKAKNNITDSLVYFGYHAFFNGMYEAYSNHHAFTLSPDMIWLLIAQGFALHVTNNAEDLRSMFVDFAGKMTLVVENDQIQLDNPNSPWEEVFPEFTKKIGGQTGEALINTLTPNFTTTRPVDKIAAQITIMEAMKEYFEFEEMTSICGIPAITLEGTPADWQKILDKLNALRKYKLDWWINEIEPPLRQFVRASKGEIDTVFWRNMFKYHTLQVYGKPKVIDGWIIKFFPYDKNGHRNNFKELGTADELPKEIVKVDLKYIQIGKSGKSETIPLELWAGFVGIDENTQTFGLKPEMGWMVRVKDTSRIAFKKAFSKLVAEEDDIEIRVKTVPTEILSLQNIGYLTIHFIGDILIPDEMARCNIFSLELFGKTTPVEIGRLRKLLPNTQLRINGVEYLPMMPKKNEKI